MGLAEDNYFVLTQYLGLGRKPSRPEYQKSKKHGVPQEWSPGQSQNWWVLGTGVRYAFGDESEERAILQRLISERDVIGCWGSEQHSPIYWAFHLVGRLALIKNSANSVLIRLLNEQIADLFVYCELALSPNKQEVLWAGMRGSGHSEFASYELWWLWKMYIEGKDQPPRKRYWNTQAGKRDYAWLYDPWVAAHLSKLKPLVHERLTLGTVGKVRSLTHFMEWEGDNKLVYTEDDQHGSTVFKGASGYLYGKQINGPHNYDIRLRGAGAGSEMHVNYDEAVSHLIVEYDGVYNSLRRAKPIIFSGLVPPLTRHMAWGYNGLHDMISGGSKPTQAPAYAPAHKSIWDRIKALFR